MSMFLTRIDWSIAIWQKIVPRTSWNMATVPAYQWAVTPGMATIRIGIVRRVTSSLQFLGYPLLATLKANFPAKEQFSSRIWGNVCVHVFNSLSIYLSIYLPTYPSIHPIHPSIRPSIHIYIYIYNCNLYRSYLILSFFPLLLFFLSYLSIYLSIYKYIYI